MEMKHKIHITEGSDADKPNVQVVRVIVPRRLILDL